MKKLMMFLCAALLCGGAFADVYDVKLSAKSPIVKAGDPYYKATTSVSYKGYLEIVYDETGAVVDPCTLVLYGKFPNGKVTKTGTASFTLLSKFGKKLTYVGVLAECAFNDVVFDVAGYGSTRNASAVPVECGEPPPCGDISRVDSATGHATGHYLGVEGGACSMSYLAYEFNTCLDSELVEVDRDPLNGTFSIRYNKSLTEKAAVEGFIPAITPKIPDAYPWEE